MYENCFQRGKRNGSAGQPRMEQGGIEKIVDVTKKTS